MSNVDVKLLFDETKADLVQKFATSNLDSYERGLKDGALTILDILLSETMRELFVAGEDEEMVVATLTEYRRRIRDEFDKTA